MELLFWKDGIDRNFGENLNTIMWKNIFPEHFFATKNNIGLSVLASGIFNDGFLLTDETKTNVIFGSGSGYNNKNAGKILNQKNIIWMFVRGPLTANIVGCKFITDPAVLFKLYGGIDLGLEEPKYITFINHHSMRPDMSLIQKLLQEENELFTAIDVGEKVEKIIKVLKNTKLLLSSSLHTAVIADLMGIPWIPVTYQPINFKEQLCYFKWADWAYSLNINDIKFTPQSTVLRCAQKKDEFIEDFKKLAVQRGYLSNRVILNAKIYEILEEVEKFKTWFEGQL